MVGRDARRGDRTTRLYSIEERQGVTPTGAPDYFKRMLLYGLYNGVATPLACDEQGRLILVVESVSPWDRSGTVIVADDFESGIVRGIARTNGTGGSVSVVTDESKEGACSCKLTGGSDGERSATVRYWYAPSNLNKLGLQFALRMGADVEAFWFVWHIYSGTAWYKVNGIWRSSDEQWQFLDLSGGNYFDAGTPVAYSQVQGLFYVHKLVIDIANSQYVRFKYPRGEVDLADEGIYNAANTETPRAYIWLQVVSTLGNNGVVYLDDIILTQDES